MGLDSEFFLGKILWRFEMIEIRHSEDIRGEYERIYKSKGIRQMESYFIWLISILKLNRNSSHLDISTGEGQMVRASQQKTSSAFGIDISLFACKKAAQKASGHITCADGHNIPFAPNSFDVVSIIGSLEHFDDMGKGIREVRRVLKPTGVACLTVPNTFGLRWNVSVAWKTGDIDDDGQPLQRYGTKNQWQQLLYANGLEVNKVLGYEHERAIPRTLKDFLSYLRHPKRLISRIFFVPLIPVNAAGQFVFLCTPQAEI